MDITPFLDGLRRDLANAAAAAGPDGRASAERMLDALEPALRLTMMETLSQAAAEITSELPAGVVEVRLSGRDPQLVVDVPAVAPAPPTPPPPPLPSAPGGEADDVDGDAIARVSLRIPEPVKARAEELAARSGHSLNAWIVTVLRAATTAQAVGVDIDVSSIPFFEGGPRKNRSSGRRMTGWV